MPPKKVSKKTPTENIPLNSEISLNPLIHAIEIETQVDERAEKNRVIKKKQSIEQKELWDLNVLLHQQEVKSKSEQQDGELLLFKAQLKQLREKLVCEFVIVNII